MANSRAKATSNEQVLAGLRASTAPPTRTSRDRPPGVLSRAPVERRVDEDAIRILVPGGVEAGAKILELHALELGIVQDLTVARVVVEHRAVAILLGCPEVRPARPEALAAEVDGEQSVEV